MKRTRVKKEEAPGRVWVHARIERPGEEDEELEEYEEILVQRFEVDPAYVRIGAGVTKKIVDFESLRVDVAALVPCYKEQIDAQADATAEWVADRLDKEVDKWLGTEEGVDDNGTSHSRKKKGKKKSKSRSKKKARQRRSRRDT